jgi:hypothetical protein
MLYVALPGPSLAEDSLEMRQSGRPHDETRQALKQSRHGSWVLQLHPKKG